MKAYYLAKIFMYEYENIIKKLLDDVKRLGIKGGKVIYIYTTIESEYGKIPISIIVFSKHLIDFVEQNEVDGFYYPELTKLGAKQFNIYKKEIL